MRAKIPFFFLAALLGSVSAGHAAEFWQKKDYRQWSKKECRKLLENSPWAKRYAEGRAIVEQIRAWQPESVERGREAHPYIEYQVRFLSALPIRQALVRLMQINSDYEKMPPEQQRAFDQQAAGLLNAQFPDTVVLAVTYGSNVDAYDKPLAQYWQHQTAETLKNFIFLAGRPGEKVPLLRYTVAGGAGREFRLTFPREHEGRPLLGPNGKTLQLEFLSPTIRGQGGVRALVEFKVKKMLMQGTVVY